ncbi:hypothetical protein G6F21_014239 [Rhizopus arrhizus]|nr:hypothetical protein G6F21_014239 [Rhizopus arrhizus]
MAAMADQAAGVAQQRLERQAAILQHRAAHAQFDLACQDHALDALGVVVEQAQRDRRVALAVGGHEFWQPVRRHGGHRGHRQRAGAAADNPARSA